jgi:glycosyltransferase involved in cell wall biosynthesis
VTNDAPYLLDVTRLVWRRWKGRYPTGIDRVCLAYLRHFGDCAQAVVQHRRFRRILDREASRELFELLDGPPTRFRRKLPLATLRHLGGIHAKGRGRIYLNIGHTGLDSPGFRDWVERSNVKPVYLVHDLIPITHPQFCRAGEADRHRARMRTVLTTAAGVIANSQATLDELSAFAAAERLPYPAALTAWLGVDPLPVSQHPRMPERPTFVALSTIEGRKNHLMLLEIWSRLIERLGDSAPRLLIIGQRGWEADPVFELLDQGG